MSFPIEKVRKDFPILEEKVNGKPLIYLDNAATTQKPRQMIEALTNYYSSTNSNVHRGVHHLSQKATDAFEAGRETVQHFIGAQSPKELIFTSGTTDAINLISSVVGEAYIQKGDRIFVAESEHHSNIVPWQFVCQQRGAELVSIPFNGIALDFDVFKTEIEKGCKVLSMAMVSNALGIENDYEKFSALAKKKGALVILDAAQSLAHQTIDVKTLDCDVLIFSAHKVYGPTGLGVLWGKQALLEALPPYRGGGEMIDQVQMQSSTYAGLPHKFEAGTPNIAGVVAFKASLDYLSTLGLDEIKAYENSLIQYAYQELEKIENIELYGSAEHCAGAISFNHKSIHSYDIGTLLDQQGIAVRTGNHCAQPLMACLNISGTIRASFALYNTKEEVDSLVNALKKSILLLS
ncbi:MAG: aminotransferase class V-fold PLP-dependent enzyme [Flavobacteriales bacterium]